MKSFFKVNLLIALLLSASLHCVAQLEWVTYTESIPENVVIGGNENGTDLPVCRGFYNGALHPGKMVGNNCNIGWGGSEIVLPEFDLLVNQGGVRLVWEPARETIPQNAVEAGNENGTNIYVGQATMANGSVHPGKVFGPEGGLICNYGYGGKEIVEKSDYKILTQVPLQLEWVAYQGAIPVGAVSGGNERGTDLLVCRTNYKGAMHPGKMVGSKCNIGWGGKEIAATNYEILTNEGGIPLSWIPFTGKIPALAVKAGSEGGKDLYVGQFTRPDGSTHAGKIFGPPGGYIFNYGYGGAEVTVKSNFRILVQEGGR